jgi:hypothetical protein
MVFGGWNGLYLILIFVRAEDFEKIKIIEIPDVVCHSRGSLAGFVFSVWGKKKFINEWELLQ